MSSVKNALTQQVLEEAFGWHLTLEGGDSTTEQRQAFHAWIERDPSHAAAYAQAAENWEAFSAISRDQLENDVSACVASAPDQHGVEGIPRKKAGWRIALPLATAATLSLAVAIGWSLWAGTETRLGSPQDFLASYETQIADQQLVTLNDGSTVLLSAATKLTAALSADARDVNLVRGAAIFDVASDPGRPFSVTAGRVEATALGTVFEVRNNGGVVRVAVEEGRVEYASALVVGDNQTDIFNRRELNSGEYGATPEGARSDVFGTFENDRFAAWRQARLDYEGATLTELVADANRYSEIPIVIRGRRESISDITVSAYFESTDTESMLAALPQLFPVEVDQSAENMVVIRIH
ncbi:MAG: FecR domain-containing protein [Pseudomonadota bacterium]